MADSPTFGARVGLAFACFFKILFDGAFAARVADVRAPAALPPADESEPHEPEPHEPEPRGPEPRGPAEPEAEERPSMDPALQLLALLQREGRFVDFVQQDVSSFSDADIGAAARVVHDGCRAALSAHATIEPIRSEEEGAAVTVEAGFDAAAIKLSGNVGGTAPHRGTLRHRGWRASSLELPTLVGDHDASVLAPAEIEV